MWPDLANSTGKFLPPFSLAILLSTLALGGCGDEAGPTQPSSPLTIAGPDAILTGGSSNYNARANRSDGTIQIVTAAWTSSDPSVATVDSNGLVMGRSHGSITLSASWAGGRVIASKAVNVINNYGGDWSGTSVHASCEESADFDAQWSPADDQVGHSPRCVGNILNVDTLRVSQGGQNLSHVSGFLFDYSHPINDQGVSIPVTGEVTNDGRLILAGATTLVGQPVVKGGWRFGINGWDTRLVSAGEMRGLWAQDLTGPSGARQNWESELVLTRKGQ